jgi:predicted metal-dependent HD superfamily phosphohydrolase
MSTPEAELRSAWHHVVGPSPVAPFDHLLEGLLARHREPHRRYHTTTHVMWVLRHIDQLSGEGVAPTADLAAVRLSALCHDAVYDPHRADNEAVSATLAAHIAEELGWPATRSSTVHRLVVCTAAHQPAEDDEALLVDADLAILGAMPKDYSAYVQGVRAEYAHVSDADWKVGRAAVLRQFLDGPTVFHTEPMRRARESRARANHVAELATLG